MTRALITQKFAGALNASGFYIVIEAGGLTASLWREVVKPCAIQPNEVHVGLQNVGILSYKHQSVDYDELMRLVKTAA